MAEDRIKVPSLQSENSSWNVSGVENEQFESMVEGAENDLSCASTSSGIYDLQVKDGDDWPMVEKKGNQFVVNGQPFYVNGFNTYWLMVFAADQSTRGKVSEVFQQASSVGLTVCRTWAFNDGQWRALQKSPSIYDEEVFKALDFVVSEAKKYKIRLILSLTNNWDAYGGKSQYVKWGKAAGLNLTSDDEFFSHPTLRSYYKAHVKAVLNRVNTFTNITYKNDPTIFAWELMNEPRCTSDPSGDTLQSWIQEMVVYVKSLDAKHLVEIGLEGFYGPSAPSRAQFNPNSYATQVGTDFIRNHQVLGVDFASVHIYADSWISQTISDSHIQFTKSWMEAHIEDAEKYLGMPVVFAEFGVSTKDPGYNSSYRDTLFNTVYKTLLNSTKKGGSGAGSLFWQLFPDGTDYMDDGHSEWYGKAKHFTAMSWKKKLYGIILITVCVMATVISYHYISWRVRNWLIIFKYWFGFEDGDELPDPSFISFVSPLPPKGLCGYYLPICVFAGMGFTILVTVVAVVIAAKLFCLTRMPLRRRDVLEEIGVGHCQWFQNN